jgi:hypothetical protein
MGELSPEERDYLMAAFLPSYNAEHGTNYSFQADGPAGADHDYVCADPSRQKEPLKIQHTRAWADPETEWRHPADVQKFIVRAVQANLDAAGVTDHHVHLNVESLPTSHRPTKLVGSYGECLMSGTVGFDGSLDYAVSVTVPPDFVGRLGATDAIAAGALADEKGRVLLDLRVTGTAKSRRWRGTPGRCATACSARSPWRCSSRCWAQASSARRAPRA